ncbi:MAG: hypothetical protein SVG88_01725 [Halobacteriales archaeon]|nr:hypothetical protein [Halobacteriales archaeon]
MTDIQTSTPDISESQLPSKLQNAGISGAGGGGFPSYVKWRSLENARYLLVNHQESEPNCYIDKWIGSRYAQELAAFFDALLDAGLQTIVIGAKHAHRDPWLRPLEDATDGTVYEPDQLPIDCEKTSGVVFAYTDDVYEYGMENVLLRVVAGTVIGKDLPVDYGWIVQNTETIYNIYRAIRDDRPVLRKYVHIDGFRPDGSRLPHTMLEAPIGTSAGTLLETAGVDPGMVTDDRILVEGGPGWCFKIQRPPHRYGIRKHTNCLLVLGAETAAENVYANGRINVLEQYDWSLSDPDTDPTTVQPDRVHVPIITNEEYWELVTPSTAVVERGDHVQQGDVIAKAEPRGDGFCLAHHAPIDGTVTDVTIHEIELQRTA